MSISKGTAKIQSTQQAKENFTTIRGKETELGEQGRLTNDSKCEDGSGTESVVVASVVE
jgi:hypothetical protein